MRLSLATLAALAALSSGCLGYRQGQGDASRAPPTPQAQPWQRPVGAGAQGPQQPPSQPPQQQPPPQQHPINVMVGTAWTLFGMLAQAVPVPQQPPSQQPPTQPPPQQPTPPSAQQPSPMPGWPFPTVPVSVPGAPSQGGSFEDEVIALTNQRRAAGAVCGGERFGPAGPLTFHPQLAAAARGHANDMAARGYFDHVTPEGLTPSDRARAAGYTGKSLGENIAVGQQSPAEVVDDWMKSPGHCSNIMEPRYTRIGVGHAAGRPGSMGDEWVQLFGK